MPNCQICRRNKLTAKCRRINAFDTFYCRDCIYILELNPWFLMLPEESKTKNERQKIYYQKNKEKVYSAVQRWRKNHPEKITEYNNKQRNSFKPIKQEMPLIVSSFKRGAGGESKWLK